MPPNRFEGGVPKTPEAKPIKLAAIQETAASMTYLGVRLEKAKKRDSQFVPKPEQYANFINDPELALPLQKDLAVAFLSGEPILVEGGTSLGKTTTVRKMCAELGYEVHYVNLNGATDVEDLMGRYVPNAEKKKPEDPEYRFADGKVTSGLRQEEGKIKVIILDEFNAAAPNMLIRLHEVIDALERNGEVVLSEDASEVIATDKSLTKVVALMNPPGKGYFGREPLDPAQLRRWVYKKLPAELPSGTFSTATDTLFGANIPEASMGSASAHLSAREQAMLQEQLQEIPGIREILEKYKEFHRAAKELVRNRQVAEDQPQPFTFDDRMEPRRVRDFVLNFYHGDINETFQQALRYYYANKLETDADKDKLLELIRLVEYSSKPVESKRRGLERVETAAETPSSIPEREGRIGMERAIEVLGRENVHGLDDVELLFGEGFFNPSDVPPIPYSEADLQKSKELNEMGIEEMLVLFVVDKNGGFLSGERLNALVQKKYDQLELGKFLYDTGWYANEDFYKKSDMRFEWKLITKQCIPNSKNKRHHQEEMDDGDPKQTQDYVVGELGRTTNILSFHRPKPFQMLYAVALHLVSTETLKGSGNGERLLADEYHWSDARSSDGDFVSVGFAGPDGAYVFSLSRVLAGGRLGVCLSRDPS